MPPVIDLDSPGPTFASKKDVGESLYLQWCLHRLSTDFPRVRMAEFRSALKFHTGKVVPAYIAIAAAHQNAILKEQKLPLNQGDAQLHCFSMKGVSGSGIRI